MTLSSFESLVILGSGLRAWWAKAYNDVYVDEDPSAWVYDVPLLFVYLMFCFIVCFMDSLFIWPKAKKMTILLTTAWALNQWLNNAGGDSGCWNPNGRAAWLWVLPMEPQIQYSCAWSTLFIFMSKCAWNIVIMGEDFVFLRGDLKVEATSSDSIVDLVEPQNSILEASPEARATYNSFPMEMTGDSNAVHAYLAQSTRLSHSCPLNL